MGLQQTATAKKTERSRATADKKLLTCAKFIDVFHSWLSLFLDENTATASTADENVASASRKVVNALNQAVASGRLKRFSQKIEQFVLIVSAQGELCPILQKY